MDAAAKPPRTGLRRLPPPDPPRHPTGILLLPLLLLLPWLEASAGAGRSPADPLNRQAAPGTGTLCRHQIANVT
ncbi:hypothetical protein B9Y76_08400 [Stenotrophomonas maltophilia]|nr:hypothetical protein [Stenotrophomonas maltophilia]MPS44243.1 hypothetical protein [Stenotrophomonas sp.]OWQ80709.1 hypothetical protein CEE62_11300 [Stenotrophomonas maltophilia]PJL02372.1 hypothetical protein B9Y76_08400 [Stenotrophomonas maltophilia]